MQDTPLFLGNVHFPHGWTSNQSVEEIRASVSKAAKYQAKKRQELRKVGAEKKKTQKQKAYLGSMLVRFSALIRAAKRLEYEHRKEISEYKKMAIELKLHQQIMEKVKFRLKKKSSGGYRYYCQFGVCHQAAQSIVSDMISAQFKPKPFQYNVAGRGVRDAVKWVRTQYGLGNVYAVRLDIQRFFDSFTHDGIIGALPIPLDIIENVVLGKHYELEIMVKKEPHLLQATQEYVILLGQRGLPQGSASSPVIANFFMSKIDPVLPNGAVFVNYVDDFLIMAKSPEKGQMAKNALTSSIEELSVGDFKLLEKSSSFLSSGVEFLGHYFSADKKTGLKVSVSEKNSNELSSNTAKEFERISDKFQLTKNDTAGPIIIEEEVTQFARYVLSWLRNFDEADDISELTADYLSLIETLAISTNQNFENILANAKSLGSANEVFYP